MRTDMCRHVYRNPVFQATGGHANVYTHVRANVYTHVCVHVGTHVYTQVYTHVYTHVYWNGVLDHV